MSSSKTPWRVQARAKQIQALIEERLQLEEALSLLLAEERGFEYSQEQVWEAEKEISFKLSMMKKYRRSWFDWTAVGVGAFLLVAITSNLFRQIILRE
jgi:hypothetical protein